MTAFFKYFIFIFFMIISAIANAEMYEINGSPFDTHDAPLPDRIRSSEKTIIIDPREHVWGAYQANGKLIRWGIATAGAQYCRDSKGSCRTTTGYFRVYSLGGENCISHKYPIPDGGAPMPYCMYFNGSQALHGSPSVEFDNISHGCIRIHIDDAKWLRHHFVEGPNESNHFKGTRIIIGRY